MFSVCAFYCSTSHCLLTQRLFLKLQQTSVQCVCILLLYFTLTSHKTPLLKTKTDKCSVHVYTLYCSAPFPHTVPPPEIMTNRCSFSTAPHQLLTQCLLLKSQLTSVQCVYTLLLYLKLPSHTVLIPEVTTDKCSVHVHSAALLCFLTQHLLNSQETSVQCMCTLLLHSTLLSHAASPELKTDKCSLHVHSTALLYTAFSRSLS